MNPPIQTRFDERIVDLGRGLSKQLPRCPRPNVGSFGHFVRVAVYRQMVRMVENPVYVNELFRKEK